MEMDRVNIQLDDGKRLRNKREMKIELSDGLRKARLEKSTINQLNISEVGKLRAMTEEIFELRKLYGKLQSCVDQKDLLLDQISSANGKLEAECDVKFRKLEGENGDLVLLLDEAFARIHDLEKKTASSSEEISGLKRLLSVKQQLDSETKNNASVDLKERDEHVLKLEEEYRVFQDQLRWRNQQFSHLEEAYKKLQALFNERESEWQREISSLLHEISELQSTLDARGCTSKLSLVELESTETLKLMLQKSESEVENLKLNLETNQQAHEQEKTSLLISMNDKDAKIGSLEQQISMLKSIILAESKAAENLNQEKDNYVKNFQNEIAQLRNKLAEREVTNDTLRQENDGMISSIDEKEEKTQQLRVSLAGKEYVLDEAFTESEDQKTLEAEKKNWVTADMEKEMNRLHESSVQVALQPGETKGLEELKGQLENETRCFENLLEELVSHKQALLDGRTKEENNRENLLAQLESMCQLIGSLCTEDAKLMKSSPLYEEDGGSDELISGLLLSRKSVQVCMSERAPLAELNVSSLSI
ncbi:uncharacterized protein At4g38062-like [Salvia splendens]|uniref:uncharacterized protein At4g38062-like n=1 Tax=Salvia splendens TaxID=180675 RepID=UPI001C277C1E|nr:uncharacterized protein At4g38062-like [Salvia splendens]XP_042008458.1 uncharacterized protein At4g38062-like [Salvia splendens]XP_042008459.1 uncharacterized protein At4g38062-like [Salvia splendens]